MSNTMQSSKRIVHNPTATESDTSPSFLSLPSELRNRIYELALSYQEPVSFLFNNPWVNNNRRQKLTTGLFRANKTVHHEASSLFYNRFEFWTRHAEGIASLPKQLGRNAEYIRHIYMDFPQFLYLDPGHVTLEDDSVNLLANIQSSCANLLTLTMSLGSTNAIEHRLDRHDCPKIIVEALKLVDTHFRAISSLQDIIVEVYQDGPSGYIRRKMESHGWKIRISEYWDEEDFNRCLDEEQFQRHFSDYNGYDSS